jgi:hypothetical protein
MARSSQAVAGEGVERHQREHADAEPEIDEIVH